ncbi:hypothetical protein [Streptomyces sp. NPDC090445]|uniref:hypothetical protein n=1 Tax=Streptomyces sp. NPDC090445 TaxID=3365963 RepID=UPI003811B7F4
MPPAPPPAPCSPDGRAPWDAFGGGFADEASADGDAEADGDGGGEAESDGDADGDGEPPAPAPCVDEGSGFVANGTASGGS